MTIEEAQQRTGLDLKGWEHCDFYESETGHHIEAVDIDARVIHYFPILTDNIMAGLRFLNDYRRNDHP